MEILKNCFIVHGSFGDSKEHYLPWLEDKLKNNGFDVYNLNYPIGLENQNYQNWSLILNKYKHKINENTIFIGRSIAPIFIIHYLLDNNLKINSLYSISGFNGFINIPDYDYVNKSFFVDGGGISAFEKNCKNRICFISKNDPYVPLNLLENFAKSINAKVICHDSAGHFNTESGYTTFEKLLNLILSEH